MERETSMILIGSALLAITLGFSSPPTHPIASGTANGSLLVDNKTIALKYAYAVQVEDVETAGLEMSSPARYLVIVLSDRKLPLTCVANRYAPHSELRSPAQVFQPLEKVTSDSMYGVMLQYDLVKKTVFKSDFFYPNKEFSLSFAGFEKPEKIAGLRITPKEVSGTTFLDNPQSTGRDKPPKKYQFRASFRATLRLEPGVTEKQEGKAALNSPLLQIIRDYLKAAKEGDVATLRRLTASSHQAYLQNPEVLKFLKDADVSKLEEQVKRLVVRGDIAVVILVNEQPNYSQTQMFLVREKEGWKLCWP